METDQVQCVSLRNETGRKSCDDALKMSSFINVLYIYIYINIKTLSIFYFLILISTMQISVGVLPLETEFPRGIYLRD